MVVQGDGVFPASRAMHHDGGNLTVLHLAHEDLLMVLHLAHEDRGSYECVASNAVANAITTTLLLIESNTLLSLCSQLSVVFLFTFVV